MRSLLSYRTVIYVGTFATGLAGLIYQVVWQKYLTLIVGSDARSVSLVVATFLAGLAAGYRFWGQQTERLTDRRRLLWLYGVIEIGIGLYAALFLPWLQVVRFIAHRAPPWLLTDVLVTVLTLAAPTFLMGATIPLLVRVVPERAEEVHLCHAKIYGINTLGACLGTFAASFVLIPTFGLPATLLGAAGLNLFVGVIFLGNRLGAGFPLEQPISQIPNRFSTNTIYVYTLITGTVTLSLEVLFVRVLNLTIGAGPHNFAIIVGVFILGLALGSLAVTDRMLSIKVLFRALTFLTLYLMVLFYTVPHWPTWLSNFRGMLRVIPINYGVYLAGLTLFLIVLLLPCLIALGFMLPLSYALLKKDAADYGRKCGWLYFYNTLGTALGAVGLAYLLLRYVNLDAVFKLDVVLLAALGLMLFLQEGRRARAAVLGGLTLVFLALPMWDRSSHHMGLYIYPGLAPYDFQGWLAKPDLVPRVLFFEDGPDTTVTVGTPDPEGEVVTADGRSEAADVGVALLNNGRSEGHSIEDFSTMVLPAVLPYLYAPDREDLEAGLVGLGMGVTAGLLGAGEQIAHTTVVEISPTLMDAAPYFDEVNFGLADNPRITVLPIDGFKYFARIEDGLDIVISIPSVLWVTGVENLFTPDYYRMVDRALRDDGIFMQWIPLYNIDPETFRTVLTNLTEVFAEFQLYRVSPTEVGILASQRPLSLEAAAPRLAEPAIQEACAKLQFYEVEQLSLLHLTQGSTVKVLAGTGPVGTHTLSHPTLSYTADRVRFAIQPTISWEPFVDSRLLRLTHYRPERQAALARLLERFPEEIPCTGRYGGAELFCERLTPLREAWRVWTREQPAAVPSQLAAYDRLRQEGFVPPSADYLHELAVGVLESFPAGHPQGLNTLRRILAAYERDGQWDEAMADAAMFRGRGFITEPQFRALSAELNRGRGFYRELIEGFRAADPDFPSG